MGSPASQDVVPKRDDTPKLRREIDEGENDMESYFEAWSNTFQFSGRASRREYWTFVLVNAGIYFLLTLLFGDTNLQGTTQSGTPLVALFSIAVFVPTISVTIRRLHDTNRSGFWTLLYFLSCIGGLVLLFFNIQVGDVGDNEYGPDPYADDDGLSLNYESTSESYPEKGNSQPKSSRRTSGGYRSLIPLPDPITESKSKHKSQENERSLRTKCEPAEAIYSQIEESIRERIQSAEQRYSDKPRDQHYYFVHVYLRDKALSMPSTAVYELIEKTSIQYIKALWVMKGIRMAQTGEEIIPADELELHPFMIGTEHRVVIIKFPEPTRTAEAFMSAIVIPAEAGPGDSCSSRYFTLELSPDRPYRTVLCEWTDIGAHMNLGAGPQPEVDEFKKAIAKMILG